MEDSNAKSENDIESQKLLYKYQYAFLHMQKSFTSLFKIIRGFEHQVSFKYLTRWKNLIFAPYIAAKQHLKVFINTLNTLDKKFEKHSRFHKGTVFFTILRASRFELYSLSLKDNYRKVKENNTKELQLMELELNNLKKSQNELVNITKNYTKRENTLRVKLESLSGKSSTDLLKYENKALKNKILEMDKKTCVLFKDLNVILDELEELKRKKNKKIKKKQKGFMKSKMMVPLSV
ncbi:hypothetical protein SteCoe_12956 [Stentor coeruleus]|uniref:Uncharacterized protein n=1 Tax=Stentor coeruleus TaxID=5963 RepID=A0A1R2C9J5_9CILI|nr:hypothetical protein SteCoe_12956 [Stentor coeruleus]